MINKHVPFACLSFEVCRGAFPEIKIDYGILVILIFEKNTRKHIPFFVRCFEHRHLAMLPPESQKRNSFGIIYPIFFNPWDFFDRVPAPFAEARIVIDNVVTYYTVHISLLLMNNVVPLNLYMHYQYGTTSIDHVILLTLQASVLPHLGQPVPGVKPCVDLPMKGHDESDSAGSM